MLLRHTMHACLWIGIVIERPLEHPTQADKTVLADLNGISKMVSDKSPGFLEAPDEFYPDAKWQRCVVHFYRSVLHAPPQEVTLTLKAIHAQEDKAAARQKTAEVVKKLRAYGLGGQPVLCSPAVTRRSPTTHFLQRIGISGPIIHLNG